MKELSSEAQDVDRCPERIWLISNNDPNATTETEILWSSAPSDAENDLSVEYARVHQPPEQNLEDKNSVSPKPKAPSHSPVVVSGDSLESAAQPIDFSCRVCGVECPIAPDPPARAVCPEHCDDHDYVHDSSRAGKFCQHCDQEEPMDWRG